MEETDNSAELKAITNSSLGSWKILTRPYVHNVYYAIMFGMLISNRASYHHGHLRAALISAARALLDADGLEAVGLRETARFVGVSATATYRHFVDKESLLAAVAAEGFRDFGIALSDSKLNGASLPAMGRAYIDFAVSHPGLFKLMFGRMLKQRDKYPELGAAVEAAFVVIRKSASELRTAVGDDLDVGIVAAWSTVHGLAHLILDHALPAEQMEALKNAVLARELLPAAKSV